MIKKPKKKALWVQVREMLDKVGIVVTNEAKNGKKASPKGFWQRIKPISSNRAKQNALYKKARLEYLQNHLNCGVCKKVAKLDIHHLFGRRGELLYDKTRFLAVCRECHREIHNNPAWAIHNGYLPPKGQWNNKTK